jgi:hypothetical protein
MKIPGYEVGHESREGKHLVGSCQHNILILFPYMPCCLFPDLVDTETIVLILHAF